MSGSGDPTQPFFRPDPKLFSIRAKIKLVQNFITKQVGTKNEINICLSTAFIVCFKIKHGGFDFHMHSSGEFSRLSP